MRRHRPPNDCARGIDLGSLSGIDDHCFRGHARRRQREIKLDILPGNSRKIRLFLGGKVGERRFDAIDARLKLNQLVSPIVIGDYCAFNFCFHQGRSDVRAGNHGPILIGNTPADGDVVEVLPNQW